MWRVLCDDLAASHDRAEPATTKERLASFASGLFTVRGLALIGFRTSSALSRRSGAAASAVKQVTHVITGCDIGPRAKIGPGLRLLHPTGVVIANEASIGARCTIHQGVTIGGDPAGAPVIGDDVNLAPGARVLGAVLVEDRCRVGANTVLTRSTGGRGPGVVYVGAKASVARSTDPAELRGPGARQDVSGSH